MSFKRSLFNFFFLLGIFLCFFSFVFCIEEKSKTPSASIIDEPIEPSFRVVLEPYYRTSLSPVILRQVKKINYRMGDRFKSGDVLIQLDSINLEANRDKAAAVLKKTQTEYESKQKLYDKNLSSFFEFIEAQAAVQGAKADLLITEDNLSKTELIAPYNGKVVDVMIEENEYPKENTEIIEIIDDHIIRAKFLLPARYLKFVSINQLIDIYITQLDKIFKGTVTRTGAIIDPTSSTIKIEAEIDNREGELIPGMTGLIKLNSFLNKGKK